MAQTLQQTLDELMAQIDAVPSDVALEAIKRCRAWKTIADFVVNEAISRRDIIKSKDVQIVERGLHRDLDNLHRAIVCGWTDEAIDLLGRVAPEHDFLSVHAERQLAIGRGQKDLPL